MSRNEATGASPGDKPELDPRTRALVRLSATLSGDSALQAAAMDEAAAEAPDEAEEVLLQSYLFLGYPATLNALSLWRRRTGRPPPRDPGRTRVGSPGGVGNASGSGTDDGADDGATANGTAVEATDDLALWADRGEAVCKAVYGSQYGALREVMVGVHPELDRWAVTEGYGKVLGRPELDLETRELCIAALLASIDATRQLHAHLRGCLNVGAGSGTVEAVLEEVAPLVGPERASSARSVWQRVRERWMAKKGAS